ncbi:MAG: hypothetical protein HYW97_01220 [Candidatus Wildermuthbacteria bacterium]|nr:hypothetical protein [Candidatus Wildermuthbacteria bacterium]
MQYAYFIGALLVLLPGLAVFVLRKDLRKEMLWAGTLALPFGFSEIFFHEYWVPPSLFNLIERVGFGIEDFLFVFSVGCIAAIVYEVGAKKRLQKLRKVKGTHLLPYAILVLAYVGLEGFSPLTSIYNAMLALFISTAFIAIARRDLIPQIVIAAMLFGGLYFLLFLVFNYLFPGYISSVYRPEAARLGLVFGVPVPEILFAISAGALWSGLYEYTRGFRTRPLQR